MLGGPGAFPVGVVRWLVFHWVVDQLLQPMIAGGPLFCDLSFLGNEQPFSLVVWRDRLVRLQLLLHHCFGTTPMMTKVMMTKVRKRSSEKRMVTRMQKERMLLQLRMVRWEKLRMGEKPQGVIMRKVLELGQRSLVSAVEIG